MRPGTGLRNEAQTFDGTSWPRFPPVIPRESGESSTRKPVDELEALRLLDRPLEPVPAKAGTGDDSGGDRSRKKSIRQRQLRGRDAVGAFRHQS
jgi:hypothetical protein